MIKKIVLSSLFFFWLTICSSSYAAIAYEIGEFEKKGLSSGFSLVKINGNDFGRLSISPDLQLGPVGVGLDINAYLPFAGGDVPSELQAVNVRFISYDHNNMMGFKWGRLSKVNFGYGLLMDNYDSGSFGTTEFNSNKAGVLSYVNIEPIKVQAMMTASNVQSARVTFTQADTFLLGSPVILGATVVMDTDGIDRTLKLCIVKRAF